MTFSRKQSLVLDFLRAHDEITLTQAVDLWAEHRMTYYCNANKHAGKVFSNMVRRTMLVRIKPGHFTRIAAIGRITWNAGSLFNPTQPPQQ